MRAVDCTTLLTTQREKGTSFRNSIYIECSIVWFGSNFVEHNQTFFKFTWLFLQSVNYKISQLKIQELFNSFLYKLQLFLIFAS